MMFAMWLFVCFCVRDWACTYCVSDCVAFLFCLVKLIACDMVVVGFLRGDMRGQGCKLVASVLLLTTD